MTTIGDPRPAGTEGPAGDQRKAGEEGPAGDPRPAGQESVKLESKSDDGEAKPAAKKTSAKRKS